MVTFAARTACICACAASILITLATNPAWAQDLAADPAGSSAIIGAVRWVQSMLLGTVATVISVLAVATVGMMMLTGRVDARRGLTVLVGCFILFGAEALQEGLSFSDGEATPEQVFAASPPQLVAPQTTGSAQNPFDPYAGASVPK